MDKDKNNETEAGQESTANDKKEGVQPETNRLVEDTNLAAKRLEDATKAAAEERVKAEESYAKMKLGGRSEAGQENIPVDKDTKKSNDAQEFFKDTALGDAIKKVNE